MAYDSSNQNKSIVDSNIDLQYVNKPGHLNLMTAIVDSNQEDFERKIDECIALSLRIDGSVDFTHVDKIYVMGKLVNKDGSTELICIGVAEQNERFAAGLMNSVKVALKTNTSDPEKILRKASSVSTDGTVLNSGEKGGLWTLLEEEIRKAGSIISLIKIWCAAHRAELVWKNTANSVKEVTKVLNVLSKMSTHFH